MASALLSQSLFTEKQMTAVLYVPSPDHIRRIGTLRAIGEMMLLDLRRPFRIAALRRAACGFWKSLLTCGGLFSTGKNEVERVVRLVRQKTSLSKKVVFLDRAHRIFHLWHVIHRPFSYAFAILAIFHIAVVTGLGFVHLALGLR